MFIFKRRLHLLLVAISAFILLLTACIDSFSAEPISEKSYEIEGYVVEEKVYHTADFPDHVYERRYRVKNGSRWVNIGHFDDESSYGILHNPEWVDGYLAIYSASHLFLWQPDGAVVHFTPYDAENWNTYADSFSSRYINGHYDVEANEFRIEDGQWLIEYACRVGCPDGAPATIQFNSDDEGETFTISD